jgi:hypothetical protein
MIVSVSRVFLSAAKALLFSGSFRLPLEVSSVLEIHDFNQQMKCLQAVQWLPPGQDAVSRVRW